MMEMFLGVPTDMPVPLGFDSWLTFWLMFVISGINAIMLVFAGYKFLQVIQLSGYKIKGYFIWIRDTKAMYWGRLVMLSFLSSAALLITNVLLEEFFVYKIMTYMGLIFYFIFVCVFVANMYNMPQKTPLKYTRRMNRLIAVFFILIFVITFMVLRVGFYIPYFTYGIVGLTPILLPLIVVVAYYIIWPFEMINNNRFIKKSNKKMLEMKDLTVIGVTGSYGKTTVKNILSAILSEKFTVCSTPYSYNTPLGLSKTILNELKSNHQIFIAEMGAKQIGDIAYLCKMVKPSVGVITGIGNQHLATFGNVQNIKKTKSELIQNLKPNGLAYFNGDSPLSREMFESAKSKKFVSGVNVEDSFIKVDSLKVGCDGSAFELKFPNNQTVKCETKLLGEHNISNILLCSSVAYNLGLSPEEIKNGISKLVPTAHRLAIVPSNNSLIVIDDAYNASVEGAKAAINVLSKFEGKKIVITPGLIELGKEAYNANFELGKTLAEVCDYVVINGVTNFEAMYNGLEFAGFKTENILRAGSLKQAVEVMNKVASPGDVVLFENDLPDNYA